MLTYTGILKVKNAELKVSDKFKKREFVLTDNAKSYPQTILFQLTQDRCSLIENAKLGDEVTVHFLLKGREWKNPHGEIKFFNSLDVFRVDYLIDSNFENEKIISETPSIPMDYEPFHKDEDLPF